MANISEALPQLRFEIIEAAQILRISRATLYQRIRGGLISVQKDGRRYVHYRNRNPSLCHTDSIRHLCRLNDG